MDPTDEWLPLMTDFYADHVLTAKIVEHPMALLTYGLGFLTEYLRVVGATDKVGVQIEHDFLKKFGQFNDEEALALRQEIDRSTSETNPLLIELIFFGVDTYGVKDTFNALQRGREVLRLIEA